MEQVAQGGREGGRVCAGTDGFRGCVDEMNRRR